MFTRAGEIVSQVLRRLDEEPEDPVFWTRSEILVLLNEGYAELNLIAHKLTSTRTINQMSAHFIRIPETAIAASSLAVGTRAIQKGSLEASDLNNAGWCGDIGVPRRWGAVGCERIFLDRYPTSTDGTDLVLTTLDIPLELDESTIIDLEAEYMLALENYAFSCARFKEGGAEFQQGLASYDDFLKTCGLATDRTVSAQFEEWARIPSPSTGLSYSTVDRG